MFVRALNGTPHPFNDAWTLQHFNRWLERDALEDERDQVRAQITALLADHPALVHERSWPEMRSLAECNYGR